MQTLMSGEPTYMRLDNKVTSYIKEMYPHLKVYAEQDGCLYVELLKAVYGCVQASPLWYSLISSTLESMKYQVSETDRCVFRKQVGE